MINIGEQTMKNLTTNEKLVLNEITEDDFFR